MKVDPILIEEASKCCHGTLVRLGKDEGQETNGVLAHVQPITHLWSFLQFLNN